MNRWEEVEPGDAWVLTLDGWNIQPAIVDNEGRFLMRDGGTLRTDYPKISAGRRIFPPEEDAGSKLDELNESFLHMRDRAAGYMGAPRLASRMLREDAAGAYEFAATQVRRLRDGEPLLMPPTPEQMASYRESAE